MVDTIITEISPTVHTFSRPFSRFGIFKIGARSTVFVLRDSSLAIISPISLRDDRKPLEYVKKLGGQVKFLIAPDLAHWLSISEWKTEFPDAKVIGVQGHETKTRKLQWDTLFTSDTNASQIVSVYALNGDLEFSYFSGFVGRE